MKKSIIGILVVAALVAGCAAEGQSEPDTLSGATDYTPFVARAVQVTEAPLRDKVVSSGVIEGQDQAVIRSRVSGVIESIDFDLGMEVKGGDRLLAIDDTLFSLSLSQLELQYESSLQNLRASENQYERGAISLSALNTARANAQGLEIQVERAREDLDNTSITAPIPGSISQINTSLVVGDLLTSGTEIGRVVDLSSLRIRLSVGQAQLYLIEKGDRARVDIPIPDGVITTYGEVTAISAGSDVRTGSWSVYVDFKNPRPTFIRAGLSADVTIFNDNAPTYTVVPNSAMVYRDSKTYVYITQGERADLTEVVVVDQYGDMSAIAVKDPMIDLLEYKVLVSGLSRIAEDSVELSGTN